MSTPKSDSSGKSSESVGSYCFIHDYKPRNGNSSGPDFVPGWWLNHHGLEFLNELNVSESDAKLFAANYLGENMKIDVESKLIEGYYGTGSKEDPAFCSEHMKNLLSHCKSNSDSWSLGFDLLPESCNSLLFEETEKLCSDSEFTWIGVKKIDPWWHAVDKYDLASLTSQKSSHQNKSCVHRGSQSVHDEKFSEKCVFCFGQHEEKTIDEQTRLSYAPKTKSTRGNLASLSIAKPLGKQGLKDPILQESDRSYSSKAGQSAAKVDCWDTQVPNDDLSRTQLLEALCHSQTRAREAEKLAQEACDEKDHVFDLFFQQASCLFAYRQWLRILQLETLCLHLKSKNNITSFTPPYLLPWVTRKGVNTRKNRFGAAKKKAERQRSCHISKCVIAFAIGLGLAGAGLLVGWTIACLFPAL